MPLEQAIQLEDSWWKNVPVGQATVEEQKVTRGLLKTQSPIVLCRTDFSLRRRRNLTSASDVCEAAPSSRTGPPAPESTNYWKYVPNFLLS